MNIPNMIKNLFKIAKFLSSNDDGAIRLGTVSMLGKDQQALIFTPYGLMHNPPPNSMGLVWSQQGQESNAVCIVDDPNNRTLKNLAPGEVAIGNYTTGNYIYFDNNGLCTIVADDLDVTVAGTINATATSVNVSAQDVTVTASDVTIDSSTMTHNGVNVGSTHVHSQGNDSDGDAEVDTEVPH